MKWLICEIPEKLSAVMVRASFPMRSLTQVLNTNLSANMNHAIVLYKLRQKSSPMEYSFPVQLSTTALGILYEVLFHGLNEIGKFISNKLSVYNCKGYGDPFTTLRHVCAETVNDIILIYYLPPESCEAFIHDHVWPVFSNAYWACTFPLDSFSSNRNDSDA